MIDPRFPIARPPTDEPLTGSPIVTNWGEVSRNRWGPRMTWRQHLKVFLYIFLLIVVSFGLYGFLKWLQIREMGGIGYKLPDYSYYHGQCLHRHKAGVVSDEYCEKALYIIDKNGHHWPRFIYKPEQGKCYDTILTVHHEVPMEYCNRKPVSDISRHSP
jgi:hypothetical protein